MQIRERGQKVICIKTEYVPEKKRTYGRQVASQDKYLSTVSESVRQQLSKEEVDELQCWLDDRAKKSNVDSLILSLSTCGYSLRSAAEALENGHGDELTDAKAAQIWEAMTRLQKALRKSGHPRPRQQKRQPAKQAVDTNQTDIFQPGE